MKKKTISLLYASIFVCLLGIILFIINAGKYFNPVSQNTVYSTSEDELWQTIIHSFSHPLAVFILQLITIIAVSQLCASLFKKIGQPAVMGEIIAGILLGPSLMGALLPGFSSFIFPASSLGNLQMLSQIGLILFMFVVGMELDLTVIKKKANTTLIISIASIVVPYTLGVLLSYFLYKKYAPANIPFYSFSLFIGIAMSITAFPVLARVIKDRNISGTKLGNIAITCAAIGDIVAWCLLAFIIAIVKAGSVGASLYTLFATLLYIAAMLFIVKPLLKKLSLQKTENKLMKRSTIALIFVVLLVSSYCCEVIGIHALFGAFMAGVIMPVEWSFRKIIIDKIEDVALVLLLPLFFVLNGLRTQIGLLTDASLWLTCLWIILAAVIGKFGGSAIAAKLTGESTFTSLSIGALMNTRGLVELVVLNIGYDLGILTPQVFTMMVIMALVTTLMASPILNLINRYYQANE